MTQQSGRVWKRSGNIRANAAKLRNSYYERNGRDPFELTIEGDGSIEVGAFGSGGCSIQFGNADNNNPFDGAFSATFARSLRPGVWTHDEEEETEGVMPPGRDDDYAAASTAVTALGTITAVAGPSNRVRIVVTGFDAGTGGGLVCWVL